ncbi:MAG: SDR family NAD(P)-dependent oxidoreductase, partial [Candidatus Caldatribacteriaceae bacterium]
MRLKDKVAIVTGAAKGIGKAIAEGFAREGARVAVNDVLEGPCREVAREIGEKY